MRLVQNFLILALLLCSLTGVVCADLTQSMSPITGKVFVTNVTFDPAVFFSGDKSQQLSLHKRYPPDQYSLRR